MKHADHYAAEEYRHGEIFRYLARHETVPEFKRILTTLASHEDEHLAFWLTLSDKKTFTIGRWELLKHRLIRKFLGLTFTAKFLESFQEDSSAAYAEILAETKDEKLSEKMRALIKAEQEDEQTLIGQIKEEHVAFIANIVLGLNDGLIELTGALVGFSFALQKPPLVALAGSITGISAALSMASSAYLQARHDPERMHEAKKSGVYTGLAYLIVVILLVAPFILLASVPAALAVMACTVFLIILGVSFYTAVIFDRHFVSQAREMLLFSVGVALVAFLIGSLFRTMTGIEV
jgi:VIT1/CCC1 family predicted Fe2+/Mn2+ transporter